jgi:high-affinity iron transporter
MILLLAAGMAASAAGFLSQADILSPIKTGVWNTSWLLTEHSLAGRVLHVLVGYTQRPSALQLIFYVTTLAVIGGLMWWVNRPAPMAAKVATEAGG